MKLPGLSRCKRSPEVCSGSCNSRSKAHPGQNGFLKNRAKKPVDHPYIQTHFTVLRNQGSYQQ